MLGGLAVELIGDVEPGRTVKLLDITRLHPDLNGPFDRVLNCCVRRRWQSYLKEIDRDALPYSLGDEAVCDKEKADIGLIGASEDELIHFDVEECVVTDVVRRAQQPQDSGAVESWPSNASEGGEIVLIGPEDVEYHVRHPAVGERDFAANWLCRKVESLQGRIGVTVVGRFCRLAHDGGDLSGRHTQMELACADRYEVHAWTRWHRGLRRCCEIGLPSHGHRDSKARGNHSCCYDRPSHFSAPVCCPITGVGVGGAPHRSWRDPSEISTGPPSNRVSMKPSKRSL